MCPSGVHLVCVPTKGAATYREAKVVYGRSGLREMPCMHIHSAVLPGPRLSAVPTSTTTAAVRERQAQPIVCQIPEAVSSQVPRRALLISLAATWFLPAQQAKGFAGWDGESAALGSCALGEAGDDCRRNVLLQDSSQRTDYKGSQKAAAAANVGVPVSEMDDAYVRESATLSEAIVKYGTMDVYDPQRVQVINLLKTDSRKWTSKYARGGSVRKPSARKIYIVVDALQGHLTSNGFAPFPKSKMAKLLTDVADAKALLAKGS